MCKNSSLIRFPHDFPATVTFQMVFSGTNLPTDATAIVDYGDGSPNETMPVTSGTFTATHYYDSNDNEGNYSTFIHVSNLVDQQSFMVTYNGVEGPVSAVFICI